MRFAKYSYRFAEEILNSKMALKNEIEDIINGLSINLTSRVRPHDQIKNAFIQRNWSEEEKISERVPMRHDLFKERVAIEIETSHFIHTYHDYLKFIAAFNEGRIDLGILIIYSDAYVKKHRLGGDKPKLSKVKKDLNLFRLIIPVPIYVIGLED